MRATKKRRTGKKGLRLALPSKRLLPEIDIDVELARRNVAIAEYLILSGLIKGTSKEQEGILTRTTPAYFAPKLFPQFLFTRLAEYIREEEPREIPIEWTASQIQVYFKQAWDTAPLKREMKSHLFTCAQIYDLSPTVDQVLKAIELRKMVAERGSAP